MLEVPPALEPYVIGRAPLTIERRGKRTREYLRSLTWLAVAPALIGLLVLGSGEVIGGVALLAVAAVMVSLRFVELPFYVKLTFTDAQVVCITGTRRPRRQELRRSWSRSVRLDRGNGRSVYRPWLFIVAEPPAESIQVGMAWMLEQPFLGGLVHLVGEWRTHGVTEE